MRRVSSRGEKQGSSPQSRASEGRPPQSACLLALSSGSLCLGGSGRWAPPLILGPQQGDE